MTNNQYKLMIPLAVAAAAPMFAVDWNRPGCYGHISGVGCEYIEYEPNWEECSNPMPIFCDLDGEAFQFGANWYCCS